ncbi:MAG: hypothetical protein R3D67_21165 [Hyphomicrobiaceae bacterium]
MLQADQVDVLDVPRLAGELDDHLVQQGRFPVAGGANDHGVRQFGERQMV